MSKKNKPSKYTVVDGEIHQVELGSTSNCPECNSLLRVFADGSVEYSECMGCGYTETTKLYRPEIK